MSKVWIVTKRGRVDSVWASEIEADARMEEVARIADDDALKLWAVEAWEVQGDPDAHYAVEDDL